MNSEQLQDLVIDALEEIKAVDVVALDVRRLTSIADGIVIASGTSQRHVQSLADNVLRRAREADVRPLGVEGEQTGDWVLVDLGDIVVHVMLPQTRDFYGLEKLWSVDTARAVRR